MALIAFWLLAGSLGNPSGGDDVAAPSETGGSQTAPRLGEPAATTTTTPPRLGERVPVLQRPLRIVYQEGATTAQVLWNLFDEMPNTPAQAAVTGGAAAAFDASHRELLVVSAGRRDTLWLGAPPTTEPVFIDVSGAAWHPTEPLRLAWLGRPLGAPAFHLLTGQVAPAGRLSDVADLGPMPAGARLVGWGDWGFALALEPPIGVRTWEVLDPLDPDGAVRRRSLAATLVLDPAGVPVATLPARLHAVGPQGHLVVEPTLEAYEAAVAAGVERFGVESTGPIVTDPLVRGLEGVLPGVPLVQVVTSDLLPTPIVLTHTDPGTRYTFTPDGTVVAAITPGRSRLAVASHAVDGTRRVITSVAGVDTVVGYDRSGTLLVLQSTENGDVVFHDWSRGISFRIPFTLGRILAADV